MERIFIPGSQWLFFKLYTGTQSADVLLAEQIGPLVKRLQKSGAIDDFFFIRYTDPLFHLRLRLHIPDTTRYDEVFHAAYETLQPCIESKLLTSVACDTYVREVERYGGKAIEATERLFGCDSICIIRILELLRQQERFGIYPSEEIRWQLGLLLNDDLLDAFGLSLTDKNELVAEAAKGYKAEFGFTAYRTTKQINDKYRTLRNDLRHVMTTGLREEFPYEILEERKRQIEGLADTIKTIVPDGEFQDYLRSLIHMTMNRLFRSQNRLCEMMVLEYLNREYSRTLAIKKKYIYGEG